MTARPVFQNVTWHSSCGSGNCVEVARDNDWIGVRDSKSGTDGPVLVFTVEEWQAFLNAAEAGQFRLDAL
ncbi:DUF397 domain-containing protein [Planotetraspora kaengkrachanensis]|uniref:DUF397 domain-containing protein n=1 Tax=Planotetraspora kaengkrachanensis TaxID=575193 RepID=A0A8J3PVM1_9ACTN|nr:DUF397 domain-containing protein [Planotetraspora kaengkrachanensis]GIG81904.1 hypothetical protein Pka01_50310 [Planotetraspora kaengkrachanensis]